MVWPTISDTKLGEYDAMDLPGQQLSASYAQSALDHILNLDLNAPSGCVRLTGIAATIGKNTRDLSIILEMIEAGMNIAVLNLDYESRDDHIESISLLRQASKEISIKKGKIYPLAIAARLTGRNIRTGRITESYGDTVELKNGETIRVTSDETYRERCSEYTIFADFMNLGDFLAKGQYVLIDNENICLKVLIISTTTVTCTVVRGGLLGSYKDVYIPNVIFDVPNYLEKDKLDIEMLVRQQVDIIIPPFIRSADAIKELKSLLGEKGKRIQIVAKIQTTEGFQNYDQILKVVDGIAVSRQELGSDIEPKKLIIAQKNLIARANKAGVPVLVSAQLLSSMKNKKVALRSELLDISNIILDGADVLVLSSETAVGSYPVESIQCMANVCKEAESCIWTRQVYNDLVDKTPMPCDQTTATAIGAVMAAQRCIASAIIVVTTSGRSAWLISKFRPRCPIIAVTRYIMIARQLNLWRGIIPLVYEDNPEQNWQLDLSNRVNFSAKWSLEQGFVRVGDPLILVFGWRRGSGFTNTMRVTYASADNSF